MDGAARREGIVSGAKKTFEKIALYNKNIANEWKRRCEIEKRYNVETSQKGHPNDQEINNRVHEAIPL